MTFDRAAFYDAELQRHHEHFHAALKIGLQDRVLDIGCGAGQSTRDAGRAAVEGSAVGVDVSMEMIAVARRRSAEAGFRNVTFEVGNAQVHRFPTAHFDLCISRFGTMFFADPVAAFANICCAMRSGARLVMMVWQDRESNEWAVAIQEALVPAGAFSASASPAFSLGDPAVTRQILTEAGFASINLIELHEPVFYGPTVDAAYDAVVALFAVKDGLATARPTTDGVHQRLRTLLDTHLTADGVLFDSRAWMVTAYRA